MFNGWGICVSSNNGKGSLFWFKLNFAKNLNINDEYIIKSDFLNNQNIFLVEPNIKCRGIIKQYLSYLGLIVTETDNAEEVLELMKQKEYQNNYSFIITDILEKNEVNWGKFRDIIKNELKFKKYI